MRRVLGGTLAVAVALILSLTGCAKVPNTPTAAGGRTTIGLSYIPDIQFAPFYVAEQQGLFTAAGVDATLRHHGANEGLFTALTAGEEDYVLAGGDEAVQARSQGMDLVAVAQYYRAYPVVIIVPESSDIRTAADLAGHSVGVPGKFGESWFGLLAALAGAGLTQADVDVVEIGYTQQAALTTGRVEAIIGFSNNDQVRFVGAGVPTRTVPLSASGDVPLQSISLVTTAAHLSSHQDEAKKVVAAMTEGMRRTIAAPASAITDAKAYIPTLGDAGGEASAMATLSATLPLWAFPDGTVNARMDEAAWSTMCTFMLEQGLIEKVVAVDEVMTNAAVTT
ncbi:ABC transporter substrate-binding protein [Propioniciclava coleopterorum]|uniref:ABC transporter substrate-binding protein n=1 Tax=Propioniciclava coleopterorum TaxID=2714937 RepID=A0A6G7Y4G5_9ACTN|nr:ABC transporter substrate-binding protein [Propioniciclava coleopterorum]QIK71507.1 ABC transporter substrate-binding protein [Propioniciclava coleopterorum]